MGRAGKEGARTKKRANEVEGEAGHSRTASGPALSHRLYTAAPPCPVHSPNYMFCHVSFMASSVIISLLPPFLCLSASRPFASSSPRSLTVFPAPDLSVFLSQCLSLSLGLLASSLQYVSVILCLSMCLSPCHSQLLCAWETCSGLSPGLSWQLLEAGVWVKSSTVLSQEGHNTQSVLPLQCSHRPPEL